MYECLSRHYRYHHKVYHPTRHKLRPITRKICELLVAFVTLQSTNDTSDTIFIHEYDNWTDFRWDTKVIDELHLQAMHRLGYLAGRMAAIGFDSQLAATVEAVTNDVVASISNRQRMVLNKYLDGYDAKLTAKNWEKIAGVSKDTALRDIDALVAQGILIPTPGRVRDIPYSINYTPNYPANESPFCNITIETTGAGTFITAGYRDSTPLRDRVNATDVKRLSDGEISLQDLAFKHFAYLLE